MRGGEGVEMVAGAEEVGNSSEFYLSALHALSEVNAQVMSIFFEPGLPGRWCHGLCSTHVCVFDSRRLSVC